MTKELQERELLAQSATGDREAFKSLVERYQGRLLRLVRALVRSREDAEDIVQESFVKAYVSLPSFRGDSSFYTWLYRIAFNMAIDFKRRVARKDTHNVEVGEAEKSDALPSTDATPLEAVYRREERNAITTALGELSEDHRAVIVLREVDGLSYDEIARVTGVSVGTVMSRLHYARKKLQERLHHLAPSGGSVSRASGNHPPVGEKHSMMSNSLQSFNRGAV